MAELLSFEYGMKLEDIRKLTRREISSYIDAMVSRKSGYKEPETPATIEASAAITDKINKAKAQKFGAKLGK